MCCREVEPHIGLIVVLWDTLAMCVQTPQIILRLCKTLTCNLGVPRHCLRIVLARPLAVMEHQSETVLSDCVALISRFTEPRSSLSAVSDHALAEVVHEPKFRLGSKMTMNCQWMPDMQGGSKVITIVGGKTVVEPGG